MNILVLDDEKEIADLVEVYLKNENYNVYKARISIAESDMQVLMDLKFVS